jgi:hypothetical protein
MNGIYRNLMDRWEKNLTLRDKNRRLFPFNWGLEWLNLSRTSFEDPLSSIKSFASRSLESSDEFFRPTEITGVEYQPGLHLKFDSPVPGPHKENQTVHVRLFPSMESKTAVIVVPQWNADSNSHIGLCKILQRIGFTAARITLPYHEGRNPEGMVRADLAVSANIGRTLHANRQSVLEVRQLTKWLKSEGFGKVGIVGTSLGSCISYLAMAHEPDIDVGVFNHVSAFFGDVIWTGLSCRYIRWALDGKIELEDLRECWAPLSPWYYVARFGENWRPHHMITAKYDLTFLPELSERIFERYGELQIPHEHSTLPCGHYTTAHFPFKYLDAWLICRFLKKNLG